MLVSLGSAARVHPRLDTKLPRQVTGDPLLEKDIDEGAFPERLDARPLEHPVEVPPRISVGKLNIRRADAERCSPTQGRLGREATAGKAAALRFIHAH